MHLGNFLESNGYILMADLPSHTSHVVSVDEEDRSQDASDPDVVLLSNEHRQGLDVHHHQDNSLRNKTIEQIPDLPVSVHLLATPIFCV